MHAKYFLTLALAAVSMANDLDFLTKRDPAPQSFDDEISDIPSSIQSQLISAIGPSGISDLVNPTSLSSIVSEVQEGNYPAWATELPSDVRDYLEDEWDVNLSAVPTDGPTNGDPDTSNGGDDDTGSGGGEDAAGMLVPSVFGSFVAAVGVLGLALAL